MNTMKDLMNPGTAVGFTIDALIVLFLAIALPLSVAEESREILGELWSNPR